MVPSNVGTDCFFIFKTWWKCDWSRIAGWHWTQTENHWSNLATSKQFVREIIAPYFATKRAAVGLAADQKAIWIIDCWPVHIGEEFRAWMKAEYPDILVLYVPPNCTGKLQPQDVVVQKPLKGGIKTAFNEHQVTQFREAQRTGNYKSLCDFRISVIKPYTPAWLYAGWKRVADDVDMVRKGWVKCGLMGVFESETRAATIKQAKLACNDSTHPLYPLFPQNDRTAVPSEVLAGITEPEMDAVRESVREEAEPNVEDPATRNAVLFILAADAAPPAAPTVAKQAFFPIFEVCAKRKAANEASASTAKRRKA